MQSRTGKSLTSGFPEIVAAVRALRPKRFVLDGELALPTEDGFSFDGLVNRLRIGSARLALGVRDSPAIYVVFDMLAIPKTCLVRLSVCAGKLSNDSSRVLFLGLHHSTCRPARRT